MKLKVKVKVNVNVNQKNINTNVNQNINTNVNQKNTNVNQKNTSLILIITIMMKVLITYFKIKHFFIIKYFFTGYYNMPLRKFSPKLNLQHMEKVDSPADILHQQIKNKYGDISSKYVEQRKLKTNEKVLLGRGAFKEAFLVIEKTTRKMSVSQMSKLYVAYDFKYPYDESNIKEISNFDKSI